MDQPKKAKPKKPSRAAPREMPTAGVLVDPNTHRPLIKPGTET